MPRYALIDTANSTLIELREFDAQPAAIAGKARAWLPCAHVAPPAFDPALEILEAPTYTVNVTDVTEVWTKRDLTAQEISDRKDAAIVSLNGGTYKPLKAILLVLVNDTRAIRAKINSVIDATGTSATVPKYPAGQTTQITMAQLIAAIKAET